MPPTSHWTPKTEISYFHSDIFLSFVSEKKPPTTKFFFSLYFGYYYLMFSFFVVRCFSSHVHWHSLLSYTDSFVLSSMLRKCSEYRWIIFNQLLYYFIFFDCLFELQTILLHFCCCIGAAPGSSANKTDRFIFRISDRGRKMSKWKMLDKTNFIRCWLIAPHKNKSCDFLLAKVSHCYRYFIVVCRRLVERCNDNRHGHLVRMPIQITTTTPSK